MGFVFIMNYCIRLYIWFLIKKLVQADKTIEDKDKGINFNKLFNFIFNLLLLTFILEISRLKRQKAFVVDLYQQKLNQIIDVEKKLDNEINKWQTYRKK
jgi:hypothetical protein